MEGKRTEGEKIRRNFQKTRILARIAIVAALSYTFSLFSIPIVSNGGSVSLVMIPLMVLSFLTGVREACSAGLIVGVLKLMTTSKKFGIIQALLDYPVAYTLTGTAGFFSGIVQGVIIACMLRFLVHFCVGLIYFNSSVSFSIIYNLSYMIPEMIITLAVLLYLEKNGRIDRFRRIIDGGLSRKRSEINGY